MTVSRKLALVSGTREVELWRKPLAELLDEQATRHGDREAVTVPWQNHRSSFRDMYLASRSVAKALLALGLTHSNHVGIMAANSIEYLHVFLGCARIGCPLVVLNTTYTPKELNAAVLQSACKVLFIAPNIASRHFGAHIEAVGNLPSGISKDLQHMILLGDKTSYQLNIPCETYVDFLSRGDSLPDSDTTLQKAEKHVQPTDVLNIQFTSGTTGQPKASMLTHINLINNGKFVGDAMHLTEEDVVCCPPPLYHCFGLSMGFLSALAHGSRIVFPSAQFDPAKVIQAVIREECTALLGVPTMFVAELEALRRSPSLKITTLRTGLAAGSPVPETLMRRIMQEMGVAGILIMYGMTETSPVTFATSLQDPLEKRCKSLGRVMPHTSAKVIDKNGQIVRCGERGELCTSGYSLQKGYYRNEHKTREVMKTDENGVLWMHTGDECTIDNEGYCYITGRIKDIIIRGGENIFPLEIEERLMAHPAIAEASVVGVPDERYGEAVGAFLRAADAAERKPPNDEIREWVRRHLGWHKAPQHIFWLGEPGVGDQFPMTGSGKHQKHILRAVAKRRLVCSRKGASLMAKI